MKLEYINIQGDQRRKINILRRESTVKKNVYLNMCVILNG